MSKTIHPLYDIYNAMIQRCHNKKSSGYYLYGERGIKVCDRWLTSFEAFIEDIGERPSKDFSIDRIDVNKGYSKENCRWSDKKTQARNKRNTIKINYKGIEMPFIEYVEKVGLDDSTLYYRIFTKGMTPEEAATEPLGKRYEYNGKLYYAKDLAQFSVHNSVYILHKRLGHGWSVERALNTPFVKTKHRTTVEIDGKRMTLKEGAKITGIKYNTFREKARKGKLPYRVYKELI